MANPESRIQKKLMDALTTAYPEIYLRKIHQTQFSHAGIPDLVGCLNGNWIAIEVKTNTGKLSKLQERELKLIDKAGGLGLVCFGEKDIQYVVSILEPYTIRSSASDN